MNKPYRVAELSEADQELLFELRYQAIWVAPGESPPSRTVLEEPSIRRGVEGFGRPGDVGYKAVDEASGEAVGGVWLRLFSASEAPGGFIEETIPVLGIAVWPGWRGQGIGTALMRRLLEGPAGRAPISLNVAKGNPAQRLYERMGFEVVEDTGASLTMMRSGRRERLGEDA